MSYIMLISHEIFHVIRHARAIDLRHAISHVICHVTYNVILIVM